MGSSTYAYSYAPLLKDPRGILSIDFIGVDLAHPLHKGDATNVRTVVLDVTDCAHPKLSTGYPGLARPTDMVNGTPEWRPRTWVFPF